MTTNDREALLRTMHQDIQRITRELVEEMQKRKLDPDETGRIKPLLNLIGRATHDLSSALGDYHQMEYRLEMLHRSSDNE